MAVADFCCARIRLAPASSWASDAACAAAPSKRRHSVTTLMVHDSHAGSGQAANCHVANDAASGL
ncbi:hypothetical protein HDU86_007707 [Geranomyces michiganensis]|nr:hypothetical protein HDU86_007707 [Geranomyces michiganensis]